MFARTVFASFSVTGVSLTKSFFCVNARENNFKDPPEDANIAQ